MNNLSKIIEYGLYLLVFFLPLQTRWLIRPGELNHGSWEYGTYSLYATDILLVLLLLLFTIYKFLIFSFQFSNNFQLINFQTKFKSPTWWLVGGWLLMSGVSIFFAIDQPLALYKFGWLVLGVGLFWLLASAKYDQVKLVWCLMTGFFGQAGLAIGQFLFQTSWANKWLGLAWHRAGDLGASVVETIGPAGLGERWLRAYGGLDHPNILGAVMVVGIILLIGEMIRINKAKNFQFSPPAGGFNFQPAGAGRTIFNAKILKSLTWVFLLIFTAALFFSFSRSAWLALASGLAVLVLLAMVKKDWLGQKVIAQVILISGAAVFILFLLYHNLVMIRLYPVTLSPAGLEQFNAASRLEIKSTNERLESIKNSWSIIKGDWLAGIGLGNYTLIDYKNKMALCAASQKSCGQISSFTFQPVHNVFLLVWAETGILGLLFSLGLIILTFMRLLRRSPSAPALERAPRNDISVAILVALIILLSLDHWLWSLHFGVLFFWLILGVASKQAVDK